MLKTEMRNPNTKNIDKMSSLEITRIMNQENFNAVKAVETELENISSAIDVITESFSKGGRLFYIGAGTSGRLGVLDASECPPTFGVDYNKVIGIIAGGDKALRKASEGGEDALEAGIAELEKYQLTKDDVVCGISAAGGAAYVVGAIEFANSLGCKTIGITSNRNSRLDVISRISIFTDTGPEVITGSTRLKAGTAQKLVLNMLTTGAMIKSGYVYENLMINLKPTNIKLKNRMIGIVCELANCDEDIAETSLSQSGWDIRKAVMSINKIPL